MTISPFPSAWDAKFHDLPVFAPITSAMYPEHDGDMAELHALADRVLECLQVWPAVAGARMVSRWLDD